MSSSDFVELLGSMTFNWFIHKTASAEGWTAYFPSWGWLFPSFQAGVPKTHTTLPLPKQTEFPAPGILTVWENLAQLERKEELGVNFLRANIYKNNLILKKNIICFKINGEIVGAGFSILTGIVLPCVAFKLEYAFLAMLFRSTMLNSFEERGNINGFIFKKSEQDFLVSDRMRKKKERMALN